MVLSAENNSLAGYRKDKLCHYGSSPALALCRASFAFLGFQLKSSSSNPHGKHCATSRIYSVFPVVCMLQSMSCFPGIASDPKNFLHQLSWLLAASSRAT